MCLSTRKDRVLLYASRIEAGEFVWLVIILEQCISGRKHIISLQCILCYQCHIVVGSDVSSTDSVVEIGQW